MITIKRLQEGFFSLSAGAGTLALFPTISNDEYDVYREASKDLAEAFKDVGVAWETSDNVVKKEAEYETERQEVSSAAETMNKKHTNVAIHEPIAYNTK